MVGVPFTKMHFQPLKYLNHLQVVLFKGHINFIKIANILQVCVPSTKEKHFIKLYYLKARRPK